MLFRSARIQKIKEQAECFLTDRIGIQESYDEVRSCYRTNSEGDISTLVDVIFVNADGRAYLLECGWDGTVNGYSVVTVEDYEYLREETRKVLAKRYTEEYGREVTVENVWN